MTVNYEQGLRMDIYSPGTTAHRTFPALIFAHGGSWVGGDFRSGLDLPLDLATRAGMVMFSIEYRLGPQHPFPAALEDVERAVAFVRAHAAEYHVDPDRIVLAGESAGGNLVSLAAVRDNKKLKAGGVLGLGAPQDLLGLSEWLRGLGVLPPEVSAYLGVRSWNAESEKRMRLASPLYQAGSNAPDFLLVHGKSDTLVAPEQATAMCRVLRNCEVMLVDGDHAASSWSVSSHELDYIVEWLKTRKTAGANN